MLIGKDILAPATLPKPWALDPFHVKEGLPAVGGEGDAGESLRDEGALWGPSVYVGTIGVECSDEVHVERRDDVTGCTEVSEGSKIGRLDAIFQEPLVTERLLGVGPGLGFDVPHLVWIFGISEGVLQVGLVDGDFFGAHVIWKASRYWVVVASGERERHDEQESGSCGHDGMILRVGWRRFAYS